MKVLFLTQACELGPSSRYRVYQLLPWLRKLGIECEVSPAIDDALYRRMYLDSPRGTTRVIALAAARRQRRRDLDRVNDFDVVFVQKGAFPGLYSGFEKKLAARKPLVFDFDDAIWLPRVGGSRILRALHREKKVQDILRRASAVIAGNDFLAEYASRFNKTVTVVLSSISLEDYSPAPNSNRVGWIGSRTTLQYLKPLKPAFETLGITPRIIASGDPSSLGFETDFRPWRLDTERSELSQLGIGVAPLPDTPWERGKCGVKILQYMACGIPVVASPVGMNAKIVSHGVNGLLATHTEDWVSSIHSLMTDPKLRERLGAAGRETVAKRFGVQRAADAVHSVLRGLV
jgi:glycosyltransferase involved in cell wall biosynthesis